MPVGSQESVRVNIVILNWNGTKDTLECLNSLGSLEYPSYSIIVVDNGSTDDSVEKIRAWMHDRDREGVVDFSISENPYQTMFSTPKGAEAGQSQHTLIRSNTNLGFAGGVNLAFRYVLEREKGEGFVWLLNNDAIVEPNTLSALVSEMEKDLKVGVAGSSLYCYDDPHRLQMPGGKQYVPLLGLLGVQSSFGANIFSKFYVSGASLLIGLETLRKVGGLDERFFFYGEDADLSLRVRHYGLKVCHCPASRVWHKGGHSVGVESPLQDYYLAKATLQFYAKNYPWLVPNAIFMNTFVRLFFKAMRGNFRFQNIRMMIRAYLDFFKQAGRP